MNRENLMQLYREYHLNDYQLRDIEDLEAIYQIDVNHLEGYRTLSDQNKQLFDKFIVNFINGLGIDAKLCVDPESIYFVEEFESAIKDPEEFESIITDPEEVFYTLPYEYKVTALDTSNKPIKVIAHRRIEENQECEIVRTDVKHYLRFTYSYKYEENTKREWLHVMSEREWY